ncbi:hypothetical protein Shyhy01_69860 [Streptomyces hygroscopicus subsp. hygroscopicus]|nr:hypothetical protein [Streptomyces hygroscopicus]GLX54037.1 hypothetical protein Shyhy01_69860 [Streptomyces hygroscopicus subsp. hygroscopicus]
MTGRAVRRAAALGCGAVWWWAVLRLALGQGTGVLEAAVAAGGWGLSVLPVHCAPRGRAVGILLPGRWAAAWRGGEAHGGRPPRPCADGARSGSGEACADGACPGGVCSQEARSGGAGSGGVCPDGVSGPS